jgi:2-phospho-L-lactate guanylyltransferase
MTVAIVPVKALGVSKSRLAPALERAALERLSVAMLSDVLEALLAVGELERIVVVTPDPRVTGVVDEVGAEIFLCDVSGLNASIETAAEALSPDPDAAVLVVLGDVAGARADELSKLIAAAPERGIALAPSSDGGTSALWRRPRDVIPASFGPDSASVHRQRAAQAGVACTTLQLPSLSVDIDERDDLRRFLSGPCEGARTRALLNELFPEWVT